MVVASEQLEDSGVIFHTFFGGMIYIYIYMLLHLEGR